MRSFARTVNNTGAPRFTAIRPLTESSVGLVTSV
ncbi:Uncharacterised protein [Mycobacterium tuberculosis]|nr:Uncharacterised protein [Mycobacterium tuberculosis]